MKAHELAYALNFTSGHAEVGVRVRSGRVFKIKDVDSPSPMVVVIELSDEELPLGIRVSPDEENDE